MRRRNGPSNLKIPLSPKSPSTSSSRSTSPEIQDLRASLRLSSRDHSKAKLIAPGTPFNEIEIDLSDSFLSHNHNNQSTPVLKKRRLSFLLGGIVGSLAVWLAVHQAPKVFDFEDFAAQFPSIGMDSLSFPQLASLPDFKDFSFASFANLTGSLNRPWLQSTNFEVGRHLAAKGLKKKHAAILIPGVISTGLESWSTDPVSSSFFRQRIWGTTTMIRAILRDKEGWIRAMSLDPITGLDPPGVKVRAAQGFDSASYFVNAGVVSYYIWARIVENLAALGYDPSDYALASFDWRLSYYNLEIRDQYLSKLKSAIELNYKNSNRKTVLVSHSMGSQVVLFFLKWVEADTEFGGAGGKDWVEKHIESWVSVAGSMLGVPKASAALLSGEMRDTVELNPAGVYLLEKLFSRKERADLFRSWAGAASMLIKGGSAVWGDTEGAPDDVDGASLSGGMLYRFKHGNESGLASLQSPNLTVDDAYPYLLQNVPTTYAQMMEANFSHGIERDERQLIANDRDHRKWSNPLEVQLPNAPSMTIYCLYGVGKATERAYFYKEDGFDVAAQEGADIVYAQCTANDTDCKSENQAFPNSRRPPYIDTAVNVDEGNGTTVKSGVLNADGDGTVSLLSLGAMCAEGWKRPLYNPSNIKVVTHEIEHRPQSGDLRGGPTTADHVDVLGNSELNTAILNIVAGEGHKIKDRYYSQIQSMAKKIKW